MPIFSESLPPIDVAGSDDDRDLHAHLTDAGDGVSHRLQFLGVEDAFVFPVGEGFAGEFQHDCFIDAFHTASYYTKNAQGWCAFVSLILLVEVFRDAFADLEADEGNHGNAFFDEELTDGLALIHQVRLKGEAARREGLVDFALNDLSEDLRRLRLKLGVILNFLLGDGLLAFAIARGDVFEVNVERAVGGDVHREGLGDFFVGLGENGDDGDLSAHVNVGGKALFRLFLDDGEATEIEFLADG
jgi:hypothetical protein